MAYRKGADRGDPVCIRSIAVMMADGVAGISDPAEALPLYMKGAKAGDAWSYFKLGEAYHEGRGVAPDPARARRWFEECRKRCELEAFTNRPIHASIEDGLAVRGFPVRTKPQEEVLLLHDTVEP